MVGHEIDWAPLIVGQINEAVLNSSISIPILCLIHRLYIESGVEILHYFDSFIEFQQKLNASLIKVDKNSIVL